ncbi:hypothetical protein K8I28_10285, partial [bacterium]|nr:hypothetical protein [bacterium]
MISNKFRLLLISLIFLNYPVRAYELYEPPLVFRSNAGSEIVVKGAKKTNILSARKTIQKYLNKELDIENYGVNNKSQHYFVTTKKPEKEIIQVSTKISLTNEKVIFNKSFNTIDIETYLGLDRK